MLIKNIVNYLKKQAKKSKTELWINYTSLMNIANGVTGQISERVNGIRDWFILIAVWFGKDYFLITVALILFLVYSLFFKVLIGKFLDKKNYVQTSQKWSYSRNTDVMYIIEKLNKIEKEIVKRGGLNEN